VSNSESQRRIRLRRDSQQWEFDRAVRDTGRVYHFQPPGRGGLPESVRMHAMISKHVGKQARRLERLGADEAAAGHDLSAVEHYFEAALKFGQAQHPIFVNNAEKQYLHASALRCHAEMRRFAPTTIEHVEIPWRDTRVAGHLHLAPVEGPAPLVFLIPGCDMTKEFLPHPLYNWANQRGMHLFVFDGPGQGESNLRDIALEVDSYEDAASTALDLLLAREEIDADKVGLYAMSFGSWWGARLAATDSRIGAAFMPWASICDKYYLFEEESPRYKQLFSFLTRARSEDELDAFIAQMGLEDVLPQITCPTVMTVGEYDPRSPVEETMALFDTMTAPAQLWVFADQHHMNNVRSAAGGTMWNLDIHSVGMDFLRDRLEGRPFERTGEVLYIEPGGPSPFSPETPARRRWFES
jgi:pimeloyl-ACP methyl ester carboxylesterase